MPQTKYWIKQAVSSVFLVCLYHVGILISFFSVVFFRSALVQIPIFYIFFLLPLQITFLRSGKHVFFHRAAISLVLLIVIRWFMGSSLGDSTQFRGMEVVLRTFLLIELVTLASLVAGLAFIDLYTQRWGVLRRVLAATVAAGAAGFLLSLVLSSNSGISTALNELFVDGTAYLQGLLAEGASLPEEMEDSSLFIAGFWQYVQSGSMFGYFVNLSLAWYVGTVWFRRITASRGSHAVDSPAAARAANAGNPRTGQRMLGRFTLGEAYIWPLIVCWGGVLASRFVNTGSLAIVAWNGGLIFLSLYALQGLAIILHLIKRLPFLKSPFSFLILGLIALFFYPPLVFILVVLAAGLGVSEIWIKYRKRDKENETE
jgi:hypothetical protein